MKIAHEWIQNGRIQDVETFLYQANLPARTLIKRDLEYVAHRWNEESFDLWEEEMGIHFYTSIVQLSALEKGAVFAKQMRDAEASLFYKNQANKLKLRLLRFWDRSKNIIRYTLEKSRPLPHKKQDLDIAVLLGVLHTYESQFLVDKEQLRSTLNKITLSFDQIYPINKIKTDSKGRSLGFALGRYPEDHYDGVGMSEGHPWFLATAAFAEFACRISKKDYSNQIQAQFQRIQTHSTDAGNLSEQFNRHTGFQRGARDLTWSYAAYITAYRACFR